MTTGKDPKEVLKELDELMDDLIDKMDLWEEKLRLMMDEGDEEALVSEAGKAGYFGGKVSEVKTRLEEGRPFKAEDSQAPSEKGPSQEELDELEGKIEDKCDTVSKKVDALMDEVFEIKEELSDKIKRSMDEISDIDIYFMDDD
jgi:hypothetical protein